MKAFYFLRGNFTTCISVNIILDFLKAFQKNLDLRICHTSSEDIIDCDEPRIVMVEFPHSPFCLMCYIFSHACIYALIKPGILMFFMFALFKSIFEKKVDMSSKNSLNTPAIWIGLGCRDHVHFIRNYISVKYHL